MMDEKESFQIKLLHSDQNEAIIWIRLLQDLGSQAKVITRYSVMKATIANFMHACVINEKPLPVWKIRVVKDNEVTFYSTEVVCTNLRG